MATYKEIKGVTVQTRDEDPVGNAGSWSSGGDLNTARGVISGSRNSNQQHCNRVVNPPTPNNNKEQYNGTSWTEICRFKHCRKMEMAAAGTSQLLVMFLEASMWFRQFK